jgi:hypothetical protein
MSEVVSFDTINGIWGLKISFANFKNPLKWMWGTMCPLVGMVVSKVGVPINPFQLEPSKSLWTIDILLIYFIRLEEWESHTHSRRKGVGWNPPILIVY